MSCVAVRGREKGSTMDERSNALLNQAREAYAARNTAEAALAYAALDEHLAAGGMPPDAWIPGSRKAPRKRAPRAVRTVAATS